MQRGSAVLFDELQKQLIDPSRALARSPRASYSSPRRRLRPTCPGVWDRLSAWRRRVRPTFAEGVRHVMKAAWYERPGSPASVLVVGEMAAPDPGRGAVCTRGAAPGGNPGDQNRRR